MPSSTEQERRPLYQFVFYTLAGLAGAISIASFAILFAGLGHGGPAEGIGISAAIVAVVTVTGTLVYGRSERVDHNGDKRTDQVKGALLDVVAGQRELMKRIEQLDDITNTVSSIAAELEAMKALIGDFIKRYPPISTADVAAMADGGGGNVVDFPNSSAKVYQLGIEEGMRRARDRNGK